MQKKTIETQFTICSYNELDNTAQHLINKAKEQTKTSYSPYSSFRVGAAVLLENGEIVTGSNQENAAYPSGICAERVAIFYANAQYPDVPVKAIAIAGYTNGKYVQLPITPCGACRQVLLETEIRFEKDIKIFLYGEEHVCMLNNVKELLPLSFVKESLKG
ncbi:MAG: cytidine deaminase [Prevotellaceae bacterium]|jgi:cytidine deaminase|nr:cytidine deaminase [Prevotellaceae bacterium]